jgi:transcriptional regulator with XRE-family HTH domain
MAARTRSAQPLDVAVGGIIRNVRVAAGISQERLGEQVGVTFQQIQKYERGANRISVSRLVLIARALGVTPQSLLPVETLPIPAKGPSTSEGRH